MSVDSVRDLARAQPWRESLDRSLERRRRSVPRARARRKPRRSVRPAANVICLFALALLLAVLQSAADGRGGQAANADAHGTGRAATGPRAALAAAAAYVNPLAGAHLRAKRIDQGVDYKGSGKLTAIGDAVITEVATSDTGWPGAFIEYRLVNGPAAGRFVFYAEGLTPARALAPGQAVTAGQPIATIVPGDPSGIEIGWGAGTGTETLAAREGQWSARSDADSIPTQAGRSFSALIASLGGPPGKVGG